MLPIDLAADRSAYTLGPALDQLTAIEQKPKRVLAAADTLDRRIGRQLSKSLYKIPTVDLPRRSVPIHPYFIGLWLGDGSRSGPTIYNFHETEVVEFLYDNADVLDMALSFHGGLAYATVEKQFKTTDDADMPPLRGPEGRDPVRRLVRMSYTSILRQRIAKGWKRHEGRGQSVWELPDGSLYKLRRMEPDDAGVFLFRPDDFGHFDEADGAASEYIDPLETEALELSAFAAMEQDVDDDEHDIEGKGEGDDASVGSVEEDDNDHAIIESGDDRERWHRSSDTEIKLSKSDDPAVVDKKLFGEETGKRVKPRTRLNKSRNLLGVVSPDEMITLIDQVLISDRADTSPVPPTSSGQKPTTGTSMSSDENVSPGDDSNGSALSSAPSSVDAERKGRKYNRLLDEMRGLGLIAKAGQHRKGASTDIKHIPPIYLYNHRSVQLHLLAGLIDSDGHFEEAENW